MLTQREPSRHRRRFRSCSKRYPSRDSPAVYREDSRRTVRGSVSASRRRPPGMRTVRRTAPSRDPCERGSIACHRIRFSWLLQADRASPSARNTYAGRGARGSRACSVACRVLAESVRIPASPQCRTTNAARLTPAETPVLAPVASRSLSQTRAASPSTAHPLAGTATVGWPCPNYLCRPSARRTPMPPLGSAYRR